jgi:tetratricopeptide (TPR) repeat protein
LALADLGAVLVEKNEHTRAESLLRECLEIMPNYYLAWSNLGRVFAAEKRYQEAQVAFAKALELNQFDRRPEVYLAALYFQMGETARARGRIDQLMKVLNALPARERARVMEMREQLLSDNG